MTYTLVVKHILTIVHFINDIFFLSQKYTLLHLLTLGILKCP